MCNYSKKTSMFYLLPLGKLSNIPYFQGIPATTLNPKRITKVKHREAPKIRGFPTRKRIYRGLFEMIRFPK